jgi:nitroreductase/NAD-dependent dihydropyrimidine dehydrogenase PreA subunit
MIYLDQEKCTNCGLCVSVCVRRILRLGDRGAEVTDPNMCFYCGHCKAVCPADAFYFSEGNDQFLPVISKREIPQPAIFFRFLRRRRSLRVYEDRLVEKTKLKMLIEAGRYAPTGSNRQACEFAVISGRQMLDQVCALAIADLCQQGEEIKKVMEKYQSLPQPLPRELLAKQNFPPIWERIAKKWPEGEDQLLHHAPALIIIHMDQNAATTPEIDAAIAATHMILLAETLGLGTCFIAFLIWAIEHSLDLKKLLQIPDHHRALIAFTVGYPAVQYLRVVARNQARVKWLGEYID